MNGDVITRRHFVGAAAMLSGAAIAGNASVALPAQVNLPPLAADFGPAPRKLEDFLRYYTQRRAVEGINQIPRPLLDPGSQKEGQEYRASPTDAFITWLAGSAYSYKWSRLYRDTGLRARAVQTMDAIVRTRADGNWDDGGLNTFFGFHGIAFAVLTWQETGDIDAARLKLWTNAVVRAADNAIVGMLYGPYRNGGLTGQYANPEFYYLSGLAAVWKLTGEERYREEAANAIRRYDDWLYKGGGVAYFLQSSPLANYQNLVTHGVGLYWELTKDPYALAFMKRMVPYYPNIQHSSGVMTDAELPRIKHAYAYMLHPSMPALLAAATGDGTNRYAADVAVKRFAESVDHPADFRAKHVLTNLSDFTVWTAGAMRILEQHPLPEPVPTSPRRVFMDDSYRGVRSHWDDFTAATTTRQMSDSLAGAYLADEKEPITRLQAAVDGIFFEVVRDAPATSKTPASPGAIEYDTTEWTPTVTYATGEGLAARSVISQVCAPYWGEMPFLAGEPGHKMEMSNWWTIQHWAVWQDYLVGLGTLFSDTDGGDTAAREAARVRWRLLPEKRKLNVVEQTDKALRFQYGRLNVDLLALDQKGDGAFKPDNISEAPAGAWTPLFVKPAPWRAGDFFSVSTVTRPEHAAGTVLTKALPNGAAALFLEPGGRKAHVWVVNLTRHLQNYLLNIPPGIKVTTYKRDIVMPPVPLGKPGHAGLMGGESTIWVLSSDQEIDAQTVLAGLRDSANGK